MSSSPTATNPTATPPPPPSPYKSESVTLILAILLGLAGINGIGHIYVGKVLKGIVVLAVSVILYWAGVAMMLLAWSAALSYGITGPGLGAPIAMMVIAFAIFAWQIIDSRKLCREYTEKIQPDGKAPW